jgi:hypothetical protein
MTAAAAHLLSDGPEAARDQFRAALEAVKVGMERSLKSDLRNIAIALARKRQFDFALEAAAAMGNDSLRSATVARIAARQSRAGKSRDAIRTTEILLAERNRHIPAVARALADAGAKEEFKQLLILSANYVDSAYQACAMLAKLYPDSAGAIARMLA